MINLKIKVIRSEGGEDFEKDLNRFLASLDIQQIVKIDHQYDNSRTYRAFVYYVSKDDVPVLYRDTKLNTLLFTKQN